MQTNYNERDILRDIIIELKALLDRMSAVWMGWEENETVLPQLENHSLLDCATEEEEIALGCRKR